MKNNTALLLAASALAIGVGALSLNHTGHQALASTTITRNQIVKDADFLQGQVKTSSPWVKSEVNLNFVSNLKALDPLKVYSDTTTKKDNFDQVMVDYATAFFVDDGIRDINESKNWPAIRNIYQHFRARFSKENQSYLDSQLALANGSENIVDKYNNETQFVDDLQAAIFAYGDTLSVQKNSVYASKAVKPAKSNYVTVSGKVTKYAPLAYKLSKNTYVKVTTYRGYKYAKLTKSYTYKIKVYAPKAKNIKVIAGGPVNHKFISDTKTVNLKVAR
ncbi:hypothetical protein AYR62_02910 [Secundilactobacillus paracollinoides]|uniref:hypothetical protein n=1 Tax=Secundilactobacillus paracollinoides TaxID=240427 RepID=UPI00081A845B|nr:hypothetical protein [Secundilactobacillus paracollinoides]ANZ63149.1 hypothetical protein AYR62_02910 [Secundilactobacillus paracollinoides]